MFIDASALTALLTDEDEARELLARLQQTGTRLTSPLAVWEAVVAVARVLDLSGQRRRGGGRNLSRADGDRRGRGAAGNGTDRARRLRPVRQGPPSGGPQFRRLLCLCLRPASGPALDVQGPRFSADRYRGRLTPCGARLGRQGLTGAVAGRGLFLPEERRGLARGAVSRRSEPGRGLRAGFRGLRITDLRIYVQPYR